MDEISEEYFEGELYFVDCTCGHDPEDHGHGFCKIDGCDCEGGWEE